MKCPRGPALLRAVLAGASQVQPRIGHREGGCQEKGRGTDNHRTECGRVPPTPSTLTGVPKEIRVTEQPFSSYGAGRSAAPRPPYPTRNTGNSSCAQHVNTSGRKAACRGVRPVEEAQAGRRGQGGPCRSRAVRARGHRHSSHSMPTHRAYDAISRVVPDGLLIAGARVASRTVVARTSTCACADAARADTALLEHRDATKTVAAERGRHDPEARLGARHALVGARLAGVPRPHRQAVPRALAQRPQPEHQPQPYP